MKCFRFSVRIPNAYSALQFDLSAVFCASRQTRDAKICCTKMGKEVGFREGVNGVVLEQYSPLTDSLVSLTKWLGGAGVVVGLAFSELFGFIPSMVIAFVVMLLLGSLAYLSSIGVRRRNQKRIDAA